MPRISVVGLGPGNPDCLAPRAKKEIIDADIIIAGKRNLESLSMSLYMEGKETFTITKDLNRVVSIIGKNYKNKKVVVAVSGDPGFYSILGFLKKYFKREELKIIPGISSIQYMFAKIGFAWENACLASLHGREEGFVEKVKRNKLMGLLTDDRCPPQKIAQMLKDRNITDRVLFIGENLSYEDERITSGKVDEISKREGYEMAVVVIVDEKEMDL